MTWWAIKIHQNPISPMVSAGWSPDMAMDQYLYIPFLGEWTSIYQLFWCELQGYQGLDPSPYVTIFPSFSPPKMAISPTTISKAHATDGRAAVELDTFVPCGNLMTWGWWSHWCQVDPRKSRKCHGYGSIPIYRYIFSGMNIHLPAILGFTRYQGFDPSPHGDFWRT